MRRGLRLPGQVEIKPARAVGLQGIESLRLVHDIPAYMVSGGNEQVFRLDLVFRAGKLFEDVRHAAAATSALLTEGTRRMASSVLAEALEYYGATVRCYSSPDTITLTAHVMSRFAGPVLEIVRDILLEPVFPLHELQLYQKKKIQRYRLSMAQNEYLANRVFSERIFGTHHPYGYTSTPADVLALTVDHLHAHHRKLNAQCLDVFLAGDTRDGLLQKAEDLLRGLPAGPPCVPTASTPVTVPGHVALPAPQPHQASVRIGTQIVDRNHADYPGMFLLNAVLGGYHGARLIRNLREDKGLTYHIQSNLESLLESTCFVVSTDANAESRDTVVSEIYREISQLTRYTVGTRELEMVKNYLCGNFLMQIDGPLNVIETIKPLVLFGIPLTYLAEFTDTLRNITPKQLREIAARYLQPETMIEVVVG